MLQKLPWIAWEILPSILQSENVVHKYFKSNKNICIEETNLLTNLFGSNTL